MTKIRAQFSVVAAKKKGSSHLLAGVFSHRNLLVELGISIERARKFILEKQHTTQSGEEELWRMELELCVRRLCARCGKRVSSVTS